MYADLLSIINIYLLNSKYITFSQHNRHTSFRYYVYLFGITIVHFLSITNVHFPGILGISSMWLLGITNTHLFNIINMYFPGILGMNSICFLSITSIVDY